MRPRTLGLTIERTDGLLGDVCPGGSSFIVINKKIKQHGKELCKRDPARHHVK